MKTMLFLPLLLSHAHADPCPALKAPTMGMKALVMDQGTMQEGGLVCCVMCSLHHVNGQVCVAYLGNTGEDSMMVSPMFCWETLGSALHEDVTLTRITYLPQRNIQEIFS